MSTLPKPTIESVLQQTREETGLAPSELRILMTHITGFDRVNLVTKGNRELPMDQTQRVQIMAAKRITDCP